MYEIDQKEICLLIRDNLMKRLPNSKITANTTYTNIRITTHKEIVKPDLTEQIMQILDTVPCGLFRPRITEPNRFIAIRLDHFADIEVREEKYKDSFEYNIYIVVPTSTIQYEWWYDKYLSQR